MKESNREEFIIADNRMDKIEESMHKEIKDRVLETDENV